MRLSIPALLTAVLAWPVLAAEPVTMGVRAFTAGEVGRILLSPSEPVPFQARVDAGKLVVRFDRPVAIDVGAITRPLGSFFTGGDKTADGQTVTLTLRAPVSLQTFQSNGPIVLEVEPTTRAATPPSQKAAQKTVQKAPERPEPRPIAAPGTPADLATSELVKVRAGVHRDFTRLVFDWNRPVPYRVKEGDGTVSVTFDRPSRIDTSDVSPRHAVFVTPTDAVPEPGKTVSTIVLPPGVWARHSRAGNRVVVDLVRSSRDGRENVAEAETDTRRAEPARAGTSAPGGSAPPAEPRTAASKPPEPVPSAPPVATPRPVPPPSATSPAVVPSAATLPPVTPATTPARTAARVEPEAPVRPSTAAAPAPTPPVAEARPVGPPPPVPLFPPPAVEKAASDAGVPVPDKRSPPAGAVPLAQVPSSGGSPPPTDGAAAAMAVRVARVDGEVKLTFPWTDQVRAAVFRRGTKLWVAFDRAARLDLGAIARDAAGVVANAEQVAADGATLMRLDLPPGLEPGVKRDGPAWVVALQPRPSPPSRRLLAQRELGQGNAGDDSGAWVSIAAPSPATPIEVVDPEVGDRLVIVPLQPVEMGFAEARDYPEFRLLETAQGIAVTTMAEPLRVMRGDAGVEIRTPRGLYLNEEAAEPPVRSGRAAIEEDPLPLFHFARWQRPGRPYHDVRQELQNAVSTAGKDAVNAARLELARFYLGRGFGPEAVGEMALVAEEAPGLLEQPAVRALRGAANLLAGNLKDAEADLFDGSLDTEIEAGLWRGLLRAKQGNWAEAAPGLRRGWKLVSTYPAWLQQPFLLAGVETAIEQGDLRRAEAWLNQVDPELAEEPLRLRLLYLKGRLQAATGAITEAQATWKRVIDGPDRLARVRSSLAKIGLDLKEGATDRAAAVDELDRLRFAWRGDRLEYEILDLLATAYLGQGDYWNGLSTLREAAGVFADRPEGAALTERMRSAFRELFASGQIEQMSPLKSLALYNEFRDLAPPGPEGNAMLTDLAGRLVGLDLLEPAASLLEEQVRNRLDGAPRAEAAADLALIRLLDRKPQQAIEALDLAPAAGSGDKVTAQHRHLRARALAELGRSGEALGVLEGDDSRQASALRADIYWKASDWANAARQYQRVVRSPDTPAADQGSMILKAAVALSLAGDRAGLRSLADQYAKPVQGTPYEGAFRLITAGQPATGQSMQSVTAALAEVDAFQGYMKSYREALQKRADDRQS